ncbi:PR domain zinc finger protein 2-like isoform X1 [Choloepus didactylus]|uniref:PR domain zinc finger protein 2-like isoform X1 n=1 Tax=Choloepus didactylus TaxID=27675 RepID=UPI00189D04E3|nr:PR domain zinc finger protein 2-like isoform X1 [Choloepus didactylus]
MNQNATEPVAAAETLAAVPEHVLRGLPEEVRLLPSAVDKTRIGVWATKPILKGKKFGPFVGDKKKRSQVKNNVYMWEVYYPNLGWMCIDATDPEKGNWLRYVNWACSGEEQNLFPLEINRAIYYKTLKPIAPGEELLVWYNGEDNPEIAAAIEEERASARSKRNSPKSKKVLFCPSLYSLSLFPFHFPCVSFLYLSCLDQVEHPAGSSRHVGPCRKLMVSARVYLSGSQQVLCPASSEASLASQIETNFSPF